MFKKRQFLFAFGLFQCVTLNSLVNATDESLPAQIPAVTKQFGEGELPDYPEPVQLLGMIRRNGKTAVLVAIGKKSFLLEEGQSKTSIKVGGSLSEVTVKIDQVNWINKSINLGFPDRFNPILCDMGTSESDNQIEQK